MDNKAKPRLSREDWISEALEIFAEHGVGGVEIVGIARRLGATSGSFYWHFKNRRELLDCLLHYWEEESTDKVIVAATQFTGPPDQRILALMLQVIDQDLAAYDHMIWVWAQTDSKARKAYNRTLRKRFDFAHWMFTEAGFSEEQAAIRSRLLVSSLMGETTVRLNSNEDWRAIARQEHWLLTSPVTPPAGQ